MAKSSRSSTRKANNQRLKANVFGPVEAARQERLSARLLEIASQPKPVPENKMGDVEHEGVTEDKASEDGPKTDDTMEIDSAASSTRPKKSKIVKRRGKKSSIIFPKFGDKKAIKKKR